MNSKVAIYYFSGTGNSLALARDIAGKMNGELVSISAVIDQGSIVTDADVIGIVFPVYFATNDNGGIPLIVGRFIRKLDNIGSKYIFAICTHSGMPGTTIEHFRRIVEARGGKLAAGFAVTMSTPPTAREKLEQFLHGKKPADMNAMRAKGRQQETFDNARRKVEEICEYVSAKREGKFETRGFVQKLIFMPLLLVLIKPIFRRRYEKLAGASGVSFNELINGADRSFLSDEKCNGCGICARVCPVGNIKMSDKKPVWQHHCENCIACYVWCPKEAISGEIVVYNELHHHPGVRLSDMLRRDEPTFISIKDTARLTEKTRNYQEVLK